MNHYAEKTIILFLLICTPMLSMTQEKEMKFAFHNYNRYYGEARQKKDDVKGGAMLILRDTFAKNPYRYHSMSTDLTVQGCLEQLDANGVFLGLKDLEEGLRKNGGFQKISSSSQNKIGLFLTDAFNRIWKIADTYRKGMVSEEQALSNKVLKAILHYGTIEAGRPNNGPRLHASCFAMPTVASNIYFCFLKQMDKAENGQGEDLLKEACVMLKVIGLQAWTQPLRHDETDLNVVSIPRFRNHVWWVGGNALGYRSLLPIAAMYSSIPMIDLLSEVCQKDWYYYKGYNKQMSITFDEQGNSYLEKTPGMYCTLSDKTGSEWKKFSSTFYIPENILLMLQFKLHTSGNVGHVPGFKLTDKSNVDFWIDEIALSEAED